MKLAAIAVDQKGECRPEAEKRIVRGQLLEQAGPAPSLRKFRFHFN